MAVALLPHSFTPCSDIMNTKRSKSEPIKTVLVITIGLLIVYFITQWRWVLNASAIVGLLGLLSGYLAKQIDFLWMKLAWVLSLIIPNILLSLIFFLFLTPIAWLSRIFGKQNQLSLKNTEPSLFKDCHKQFDKKSFERPW